MNYDTRFDFRLCAANLEAVRNGNVPLHAVLDGVGAGEELSAVLLAVGGGVGIHVLVKELPHVVGKVQHLEVLGVPVKRKYQEYEASHPHD